MKVFVIFSQNMLMKKEMNPFYIYEHKNQFKLFCHNELKFQTKT